MPTPTYHTTLAQSWPQNHAWVRFSDGWNHIGFYDAALQYDSVASMDVYGVPDPVYSNGRYVIVMNGTTFPVYFTPSGGADPDQWYASMHTNNQVAKAAKANNEAKAAGAARISQVSGYKPRRWTERMGSDGYLHAFANNRDLGLLVLPGKRQVVLPAAGGRLWALYDLRDDGVLSFIKQYGAVPGTPDPPNKHLNEPSSSGRSRNPAPGRPAPGRPAPGRPVARRPAPTSTKGQMAPADWPGWAPQQAPAYPGYYLQEPQAYPGYYPQEPAQAQQLVFDPETNMYHDLTTGFYYDPATSQWLSPSQVEIDPAEAAFLGAQYGAMQGMGSSGGSFGFDVTGTVNTATFGYDDPTGGFLAPSDGYGDYFY